MKQFNYLTHEEKEQLFFSPPIDFDNHTEKDMLAHAIGAALYMPATRETIAEDIRTRKHEGLVSIVIDLEDAVGDLQIELAEETLIQQLDRIEYFVHTGELALDHIPLLFIRVRSVEQLKRMISQMEETRSFVTGFVLPKFTEENGWAYFHEIALYNKHKAASASVLYGLPILESASVIYRESRVQSLMSIKKILETYREYVLNVRIGATDFSSLFGLRRSPDSTIYDIAPIRDCLADIINIFGRFDSGYVISGPVWEYFSNRERVLKPQLRLTPFEEALGKTGRDLRTKYITNTLDGLIREVILDKENGIIGKTIIHPTHIKPVQALYAVTHEEYVDAMSIIVNNDGFRGVMKSEYANKMNEIKPHLNWANRILFRSKIYGVLHEHQHFIGLLPEHAHTYVSYSG
ncbi:ATP/GTP-binding protein [Paenibacillus baekrokdamisoli]|uniref:ATP/GTP-binding protein n=1 Tax=Paenibacillus baekrokdamisoli TaxID=1712516 RepID=A0A3G9JFQ9_9BACL|nr:HpcH/HpaI aldolase/citrate lyase family protein [Paenibacillus baekrokdamisoli]MBB3068057.1 citrate lyase beta subunit [Paenibacillus baekrokdamisoli]BBH22898.1 ATP/GTP-binding protein [Paenibacillus baekrokdamisoli]